MSADTERTLEPALPVDQGDADAQPGEGPPADAARTDAPLAEEGAAARGEDEETPPWDGAPEAAQAGHDGAEQPPDVLAEAQALHVHSVAEADEVKAYLDRLAREHDCTISASMRTVRLHERDDDGIDSSGRIAEGHAPRKHYRRDVATIRFRQTGAQWSIEAERAQPDDEREFGPTEDEKRDILAALASVVLPRSGPVPNSGLRQVRLGRKGEKKLALLRDVDLTGLPRGLVALIKSAPEAQSVGLPWQSCARPGIDLPDKTPIAHSYFVLRNPQGEVVMVQHRIDCLGASKSYVPYSYWIDAKGAGQWHRCEPEDKLPLYGIEQCAQHRGRKLKVFLHEGAKAAAMVRRMVEAGCPEMQAKLAAHPWREDLQGAVHLGWVGGALNPGRTDWKLLDANQIEIVYIVADQDDAGRAAAPMVSRRLRGLNVFGIEFPTSWPDHFDLADDLPAGEFKKVEEGVRYTGAPLSDYMQPATWATEFRMTGRQGRPKMVLTQAFSRQWIIALDVDMFVNAIEPRIQLTADSMAKRVRRFADGKGVEGLLLNAGGAVQTDIIAHVPGLPLGKTYNANGVASQITSDIKALGGKSFVNCYDDSRHLIEARRRLEAAEPAGDAAPWDDFLRYLFPDDDDRAAAEQWCMTLIARPETRMAWGLLVVSKTQGTGKTTLGAEILWPLAGIRNGYAPNERELTNSSFNSQWAGKKRLLIVDEIYQGQNWTAYNSLKSKITEGHIEVNGKNDKAYMTVNFVHIYACSNSERALRIDNGDRRWGVLRATERKRPLQYFQRLRRWLVSGGLDAIADRAVRWELTEAEGGRGGRYVQPGEEAPYTQSKKVLAKATMPEAAQSAVGLCEAYIAEHPDTPFAMSAQIMRKIIADSAGTDSSAATKIAQIPPDEFEQAMSNAGMQPALTPEGKKLMVKLRHNGVQRDHYPFLSPAAGERLARGELDERILAVHGEVNEAAVKEQLRQWLVAGERALAGALAAGQRAEDEGKVL